MFELHYCSRKNILEMKNSFENENILRLSQRMRRNKLRSDKKKYVHAHVEYVFEIYKSMRKLLFF